MNDREQIKFNSEQKPETEAKKEAPAVQESPEALRDRMGNQAASELATFQKEGNQRLEAAETRAASEGLTIDNSDKATLRGLNGEADHVRQELVNEISDRLPQTPPPFTPENINAPQHVIDTYFPTSPPLPQKSSYLPPPPFPSEKRVTPPPLPEEYRTTPPPIPKEYLKAPPPPPGSERQVTPPPFPTPPPLPKEFSDVPPPPFAQKNITPPPLPKEYQVGQQPDFQEQTSAMKAREVESAEALTAREASKNFSLKNVRSSRNKSVPSEKCKGSDFCHLKQRLKLKFPRPKARTACKKTANLEKFLRHKARRQMNLAQE